MAYIQVEHLKKTFTVTQKAACGAFRGFFRRKKEEVQAVKDLSFSISAGELVGYIGPNGAGKSTTVKILSGILAPDGGSVTIGGLIPWADRKRHVRDIGVVFGQRTQLWWDVPVIDSYSLLKDIYRVEDSAYHRRLEELTQALDTGGFIHTPLRQLSLGQRMRAELCASLLHSPKLLFLDEPTIGLDAVSKLSLRDFLKRENSAHGTTILLTTHDMEDIAALCSRVMVIGHGSLLYDGGLPQLLNRYDTVHTLHVTYEGEPVFPPLPQGIDGIREGENRYAFTYSPQNAPTASVLALAQSAGAVKELTLKEQNLDQLVAAMYKEMAL